MRIDVERIIAIVDELDDHIDIVCGLMEVQEHLLRQQRRIKKDATSASPGWDAEAAS